MLNERITDINSVARSHEIPSIYLDNESAYSGDGVWCVKDQLTIGREAADITLAVPALSRLHASIVNEGSRCHITDLKSKNGTAVNGVMLDENACHLAHGDSIVLAGSVSLRYHDPNATPSVPRLGKLKGLWLDEQTQDVWIDAQRLHPPLSVKQNELLQLIVSANGSLVTRDEMIDQLWPQEEAGDVSNDALDSLIKRMRRRLAELESDRPAIELIRGRGLRLRSD